MILALRCHTYCDALSRDWSVALSKPPRRLYPFATEDAPSTITKARRDQRPASCVASVVSTDWEDCLETDPPLHLKAIGIFVSARCTASF